MGSNPENLCFASLHVAIRVVIIRQRFFLVQVSRGFHARDRFYF